ncbi:hypothetical protein [Tenacibaculum ovolyticum]|uniref:hypothetical protein n=1 Tax=Tenacibaculum ovolyticum TaxID=104270 RepID=UPI001F403D39|nr:hypothetical protein [Tenacibaculum ovolyticum]
MKKSILNLGKALNKAEQKEINGGLNQCNTYSGPIYYDQNNCDAFNALPFYHQNCVMVHVSCFPR